MPVIARVYAILAKYAALGIAPVGIPPVIPDFPNPLEELPSQRGTDLAYLRAAGLGLRLRVLRRARARCRARTSPTSGPDVRIPVPQPALIVEHGRAHERRVAVASRSTA